MFTKSVRRIESFSVSAPALWADSSTAPAIAATITGTATHAHFRLLTAFATVSGRPALGIADAPKAARAAVEALAGGGTSNATAVENELAPESISRFNRF